MATTSHFECVVPILVTTLVLAEFPKVEWVWKVSDLCVA